MRLSLYPARGVTAVCPAGRGLVHQERPLQREIHDKPSDVSAKEGQVIVDGPDGVAVNMTPEAAVETSHRLLDKGTEAAGQRRFRETDHPKK